MTKIFAKENQRIQVADNASTSDFGGGWTEEDTSVADRYALEFTVREIRNGLLSKTDWWAVSDRTMTAEQTAYRQALRDITTHANWPNLVNSDWPTKPE